MPDVAERALASRQAAAAGAGHDTGDTGMHGVRARALAIAVMIIPYLVAMLVVIKVFMACGIFEINSPERDEVTLLILR